MTPTANTAAYADFQGLGELKRQARSDSRAALEGVARQFESLFLQMMLKSMRDAELGEDLFGSDQTRLYQEMHDKQLASNLSGEGGGLGLARMLVQQLQGATLPPESETASRRPAEYAAPERSSISAVEPVLPPVEAAPQSFDSPEAFVRGLWPLAQKTARRLGVAPEALIAQAALETGWGKAVIRQPDGHSSHNLFNIKADGRWDGARVSKATLEYREGVARHETAPFRAYGSFAESFEDYADFLTSSPRYQRALAVGSDPAAFIAALHTAGYATDPRYAEKVTSVLGRLPSLGASAEA